MTYFPAEKRRSNVPRYGVHRCPACVDLQSPRKSRVSHTLAFLFCFALAIGAILGVCALIGGAP